MNGRTAHGCSTSCLAAAPRPIVDVDGDTLAVMMFTSGTAGAPRAAMLSHRNLASNIEQALTAHDHLTGDDIVYGVLPLFHIFGLNVLLGIGLTVGATLVLVQRFDPSTAVESIISRGITVVPGAPPMWTAFAHFDELPADSFASVRIALSGASRLATRDRDAVRGTVRPADRRGLRPHRGVADRHELGRHATPLRLGRPLGARCRGAADRRRR